MPTEILGGLLTLRVARVLQMLAPHGTPRHRPAWCRCQTSKRGSWVDRDRSLKFCPPWKPCQSLKRRWEISAVALVSCEVLRYMYITTMYYVYHTFYFYILSSHGISWATLRDGSLPLNASCGYWISNQDKPYKQILWSAQIALSTMQPNKGLPYFAHTI